MYKVCTVTGNDSENVSRSLHCVFCVFTNYDSIGVSPLYLKSRIGFLRCICHGLFGLL